MRNLVLVTTLALSFAACNDDNLMGGGSDMRMPGDMAMTAMDLAMRIPNGVTCGSATCTGSQVCCIDSNGSMCVTPGSCPDGGASEMCDGPEDCATAGSPDCCVTATIALGQGDAGAMPQSANASCVASCAGSANLVAGSAQLTTRLCHTTADCTGFMGTTPFGSASFDGCCSTPQAPGITFCAPSQFMNLMGGLYKCN